MRKLAFVLFLSSLFPLAALGLFPLFASAHGGVDDDELIVRMTDAGFAPEELTVTQGDVVLFINNGDNTHWPAYKGDAGSEVLPGGSAKLAFPKPGTFRVTDKRSAHATLTVVSLANPAEQPLDGTAEAATAPSFWARLKSFFARMFHPAPARAKVDAKVLAQFKALDDVGKYQWINDTSAKDDPKTAWDYLIAAYTTPEGVVGNAHDMAHLVGQLLYKKYSFAGLATCTPTFAFGCYHGVMQVAFDPEKPAEFPAQLAAAKVGCESVGATNSPSYWSCIHGVGHGVATYRAFDLGKALKDCDTYGERFAPYCHDGVFMEFVARAPAGFYKASDPIYPCKSVDAAYTVSCARNQVQVMKQKFHMQDADIAKACLASRNKDIVYHCVDALGYGVAQASGGKAETVIAGCNVIADKPAAAQCLAAAAGELVFQDTAGWQASSETICKSLTNGSLRASCEERVMSVKQSYGR